MVGLQTRHKYPVTLVNGEQRAEIAISLDSVLYDEHLKETQTASPVFVAYAESPDVTLQMPEIRDHYLCICASGELAKFCEEPLHFKISARCADGYTDATQYAVFFEPVP